MTKGVNFQPAERGQFSTGVDTSSSRRSLSAGLRMEASLRTGDENGIRGLQRELRAAISWLAAELRSAIATGVAQAGSSTCRSPTACPHQIAHQIAHHTTVVLHRTHA